MLTVCEDDLPLQSLYRWERERAGQFFLTQPFGGGNVRNWTWASAAAETRRMAAYLKSKQWPPHSTIAILSKNCSWWLMADLAIWMSGHVTAPIYPSLRSQSVGQILEHSDARACFVGATDESDPAGPGIPAGVEVITFPTISASGNASWDSVIAECPPLAGNPTRPADDLATIIYTSGTTGIPKGVMHGFSAMSFVAKAVSQMLRLSSEERVLSYLPLAHIVERMGVEVTTLTIGSRIFFSEGVETFLADLHRARPTIFLSVPRLLQKFQQGVFAKIPQAKLDRLLHVPVVGTYTKWRILHALGLETVKHAACGAAPLPPQVMTWYRNLGLNLLEGYGMTETLITHLPYPDSVRPGCVGPPLPGVETKLSDAGELLVRSPMNMLGYYKDPHVTSAAFTEDGFFRTGDLGSIEPDGQLKIVGRVKEQFKTSKGKYVAPAPIETRLISHPAVEACCLMGAGLSNPFAVVVLSPEVRGQCTAVGPRKTLEESLAAQMEQVNAQLDPHERVSFIAVADGPWTIGNGFMTPTLKLRRSVLESRYQTLVEDWEKQGKPIVWETTP